MINGHQITDRVFCAYLELLNQFGTPGPWPWFGGIKYNAEEITISAILTQATNWRNAELALEQLRQHKLNSLSAIGKLTKNKLPWFSKIIRPSGFYQQKTKRLWSLAVWVKKHGGLKKIKKQPLESLRGKLLALDGIGPETADTILLYALNKPIFVIDEYTKRFIQDRNLTRATGYQPIQKFFEARLPRNIKLYQDYHALIVRWGKGK